MENNFRYFSKDVAEELKITTSTLRRWSILLEKEGYIFQKNDKEQRIYYERDFKAFRELKKLLSNSVSVTDAIKAITSRDFERENNEKTLSVYSKKICLSKRELEEIIKKAVIEEREVLLQKLEEKIEETFSKQLEKTFEEKQKLLVTTQNESQKLSWWNKLFKKYS